MADLQLRAFYQKMAQKGLKPKVEQLEQLRVEFDDANSTGENAGALPHTINSKQKYDNGPSNNARANLRRKSRMGRQEITKATFGFMEPSKASNSDEEEEKNSAVNNRIY